MYGHGLCNGLCIHSSSEENISLTKHMFEINNNIKMLEEINYTKFDNRDTYYIYLMTLSYKLVKRWAFLGITLMEALIKN